MAYRELAGSSKSLGGLTSDRKDRKLAHGAAPNTQLKLRV
jgi:hypothetical protein